MTRNLSKPSFLGWAICTLLMTLLIGLTSCVSPENDDQQGKLETIRGELQDVLNYLESNRPPNDQVADSVRILESALENNGIQTDQTSEALAELYNQINFLYDYSADMVGIRDNLESLIRLIDSE
jgi:hypothetical protein